MSLHYFFVSLKKRITFAPSKVENLHNFRPPAKVYFGGSREPIKLKQ